MQPSWNVMRRYAPFLLLATLQLLVLVVVDERGTAVSGIDASFGAADGQDSMFGASEPVTPGGPAEDRGAVDSTATDDGASAGAPEGDGGGGTATAPGTGASPPADAPAGGPAVQQYDDLGRPVTGDRTKCAPGGLLQEAVTTSSPPCVPRFEGDNGGATWNGVTRDEIRIVMYRLKSDEGREGLLRGANLGMTEQDYRDSMAVYARFIEKHYELYGRKIRWIFHQGKCDDEDATCMRPEAKSLKTLYDPFYVIRWSSTDWQFFDELARNGIVASGIQAMPPSFYAERAPYLWDRYADGFSQARTNANYWCNRLRGKNAVFAGDPLLRTRQRKLGIVVGEDPMLADTVEYLVDLVSGGECGTAAERPRVYTFARDPVRAQEQFASIISQMRADGVTTTLYWAPNLAVIFGTRAADAQQYYPENMMSGVAGMDHDYSARLASPTQWQNAFGLSWFPETTRIEEQDDYKAAMDVGGPYVCYLCVANFLWMQFAAIQIQAAGPNLTPHTLERGTQTLPQLAGWSNPSPWPGWVCCNPRAVEWKFGPGRYTAYYDTRLVYWSNSEPSKLDGRPGSLVCIERCRRYEVGSISRGEPRPPR